MTVPVNGTNRWFVQLDTKIKELEGQLEIVIPYLRNMQERGDDRPCNTDVFLVHLLEYEDDHFDRTDRIRCWIHGDWDGALEDLPELPKGTDV